MKSTVFYSRKRHQHEDLLTARRFVSPVARMAPRRPSAKAQGTAEGKQDKSGTTVAPPARGDKGEKRHTGSSYNPSTSELEKKRLQVADELHKVEQQIFDLETKYLEQSTPFGNAIRGYEGFLGGIGQANKKVTIKPEDRIFSGSFASK